VAYRWDGEQALSDDKLVWVDKPNRSASVAVASE